MGKMAQWAAFGARAVRRPQRGPRWTRALEMKEMGLLLDFALLYILDVEVEPKLALTGVTEDCSSLSRVQGQALTAGLWHRRPHGLTFLQDHS